MVQKFYKELLFILFISLITTPLWGMEKIIEFDKDISPNTITLTPMGDLIITGYTMSPTFGMKDALIAKFKQNGKLIWLRHYGGLFDDWGEDIYANNKKIYIIGTTNSFGTGCSDIMFLIYSDNGKKEKMLPYGSTYCEEAKAFVKDDKGFAILGKTRGSKSSFILFTNKDGSFREKIKVPHLEYPEGILYKRGVGYLIFGATHDFDHDFKIGGYVALYNPDKVFLWEKVLGDKVEYFLKSAAWTDFGIIFGGFSGLSLYNFWSPLIIKLDLTGDIKYERIFKLKNSAGIIKITYYNKKLYGVGFIKKEGGFHPALFEGDLNDNFKKYIFPYIGELTDIKIQKKTKYYTGYILKKDKRILFLGSKFINGR